MRVVGLLGYAGVGKDTVADIICGRVRNSRRGAFADSLREEVASAFCLSKSELTDRATKETKTDRLAFERCQDVKFKAFVASRGYDLSEPRSPREVSQTWGDYRRSDDPLYFVEKLRSKILLSSMDTQVFVVTDVRYMNELKMVKKFKNHTVVWVSRPGVGPVNSHSSDNSLRQSDTNVLLSNAGSLDALSENIAALLGL